MLTLLEIIQDVSGRLSLAAPTSAISSTDQTVVQLVKLANEEGRAAARGSTWQALRSEHTFTTVAAALQVSSVPTDFDWIIPETIFNRTTRRRVDGPVSPEDWQLNQATLVTLVNPAFMMRGNAFYLTPTPSAGDTVAYEYMGQNWCQSALSVGRNKWGADTDTPILDDELHILGIKWRWRKAKGFDYSEEFRDYETMRTQMMIRDGARPRIQTGAVFRDRVPHAPQMPETITF